MSVALAAVHEQLRRDTALMFKYDYANLSAAESVRLDRAAMLRLELEDCQNKKLAGQPFDMNKYVVASEALERMLSPDGTGTDGDFETRFKERCAEEFAGAHEKLSQLLTDRHEHHQRFNASHPDEARLKFERELQDTIDKYQTNPPKPTVEWVRDGTRCFFSEGYDPNKPLTGSRGFVDWVRADPPPAKIGAGPADLDAPPTPAAPQPTSNQPPLPHKDAPLPRAYLADHSQPWRVVEGGASLPPPGSNRSDEHGEQDRGSNNVN